jgi:hypothetical protein
LNGYGRRCESDCRFLPPTRRLETSINEIEHEIRTQQAEIGAVKRQFLTDIERLGVITGESRTLLLEVPSESR